jgi:fatty acid desaturase
MLSGFDERPSGVLRLEILLSLVVQAALFLALDLSWGGWLLCYAAFAVNWSSLQYADHAWSELDVLDGAWDLRVNPVVRFLFLNYHHHRAHHRNPGVPWIHLPRYVDFSQPRPSFLGVWLSMWRGPRPFPGETLPVETSGARQVLAGERR